MEKDKLNEKDVGIIEDLSFVLANLVAIEHHANMSCAITHKQKWLEISNVARKMRTKWLDLIVKKSEAHEWCISKHCLAVMMGLMEVSNRFNSTNQEKAAMEASEDAAFFQSLIIELNKDGEKNDTSKKTSA